MEKDSRGKEIYLGLATVRTSDRHKKGVNRNSLLPQEINRQPNNNNKQQPSVSNTFPYEVEVSFNFLFIYILFFKDNLKSPTGENSEGITDGADNIESCGGMVTSTSSSVLICGGFDKDKFVEKKENHKEKKKRAKRLGSGLKNDEGFDF